MSTPGERIRDAIAALGATFKATVDPGNEGKVATPEQLAQFRADMWNAVAVGCLPRTAEISISQTRASAQSLSGGDHVEFDSISGVLADDGLVTLSLGTGQAQGKFTLSPGYAYRVIAQFYGDTINGGHRIIQLWSETDGARAVGRNSHDARDITTMDSDIVDVRRARGSTSMIEVAPSSALELSFRFLSTHGALYEGTRVLISEVAK